MLPELLKVYQRVDGLQLKPGWVRVAHVAHGWFMRCQRGVEAVLLLEAQGYQEEAAPIRRSILEHAVSLNWLASSGEEAIGTLLRGAAHEAGKRKNSVLAAGWTSVDPALFDRVIDDGNGWSAEQDFLLHFKQRCDAFGSSHDWVAYLAETARSHPGWESAASYILPREDGTAVAALLTSPRERIPQAGYCALALFQALLAVNEMLDGSPLETTLDELGTRLKDIVVRQRVARGLPIPEELAPEQLKDE